MGLMREHFKYLVPNSLQQVSYIEDKCVKCKKKIYVIHPDHVANTKCRECHG